MKVYLLQTDEGKRLFYSEGPDQADEHPVVHTGPRGWFERKVLRIKSSWAEHSQHGMAARLRHVWEWLQRHTFADESLLVRLRSAPEIEVHYPSAMSSAQARTYWEEYLAGRRRRHLPWLGVNALISPLTVVLAPLPGPNLVGYWFAYRAVRHLLAVLGLRRVRGSRVSVSFHPSEDLDRPVGKAAGAGPCVSASDPAGLEDFLKRSGVAGRPMSPSGTP